MGPLGVLGVGTHTLKNREPPVASNHSGRASATFEFARIVKDTGIAVLVGQPAGGNRRGNGGSLFFLRLPDSGITVDLTVISWMPRSEQPDAPIMPDIRVTPDLVAVALRMAPPELLAVRAQRGMQRQEQSE